MTSDAKTHKITLIPADGIGPEVAHAAIHILESSASRSIGNA